MVPRSILVTGASRGIGLELVKQIAGLTPVPGLVIAACRDPDSAQELKNLQKQYSSIRVIQLDIANEESIQSAFDEVSGMVGDKGLNALINNAGISLRQESINDVTFENLLQSVKVNLVGPAIVTKVFLPLLRTAASGQDGELSWSRAAIINISSRLGSIEVNVTGQSYQYREAKTALNQFTKTLSIELSPEGILATCIHPGWVRTDMGGQHASVGTEESVAGMIKVFQGFNSESGGKFHTYDGHILPW